MEITMDKKSSSSLESHAAEALANQRLIYNLKLIIAIQTELTTTELDLDKFMNHVVEQTLFLTPSTGAVIELVEDNNMVYRAASGSVSDYVGMKLNIDNSISGLCIKQKEIVFSDDTENDSRVDKNACRKINAKSLIACPLFHQDRAIGVLKIISDKSDTFHDSDIQMMQIISGFIGTALAQQLAHQTTENALRDKSIAYEKLKEAEKKLAFIANHDHLTQLPNRHYFSQVLKESLSEAIDKNYKIALIYLDIDYFKQINDTHGHDIGDQLLKAFAQRLERSIRQSDTATRLGGDEFIVLLRSVTGEEPVKVAINILKNLTTPFKFGQITLNIGSSIGIAILDETIRSPDDLIKNADKQLYEAKKAGRNCYKIAHH